MSKVHRILIEQLVGALDRPLTLREIGIATGFEPGRILAIIVAARAAGYDIRAVEDGITRNVPLRAATQEGAFGTVFEVAR